MDILYISSTLPNPPTAGVDIVINNRIRRLTDKGHNIYFLTRISGSESEENIEELRSDVKYLKCFQNEGKISDYFKSFCSPTVPYNIQINNLSELEIHANQLLAERDIDLVFTDHLYASGSSLNKDIPEVLGVHNLEFDWFRDSAKLEFPNLKAVAYAIEATRMYYYEQALYNKNHYEAYEFVSHSELQWVKNNFPGISDRLSVSPIGIDVDRFAGVGPAQVTQNRPTILFTGSMSSRLNSDAVEWFSKNVFGKIKSQIPTAQFLIVGNNPTSTVKDLADIDDVVVTGRVEQIEPYIVGADLVVIPLRGGAGVKVKLLEALAAGKLVLTTDYGISGTNIIPGEQVLHANSAKQFTKKSVAALSDPEEFASVCERGNRYVRNNHAWSTVIDDLESRLQNLVNK